MSPKKIISVHQPNFFPWSGYFYKILKSNVFVFLDDAQFSKGSYTNRSKILIPHSAWLTLPVTYRSQLNINETHIAGEDWVKTHLSKIANAYRKAPCYQSTFELLEEIYLGFSGSSLSEFNIRAVCLLCEYMEIDIAVLRSSELDVEGSADHRLVSIVSGLGGDIYLSGSGGKNYQSDDLFSSHNIELMYTDFAETEYPQSTSEISEFVSGLSVIDMLMNVPASDSKSIIANQ